MARRPARTIRVTYTPPRRPSRAVAAARARQARTGALPRTGRGSQGGEIRGSGH